MIQQTEQHIEPTTDARQTFSDCLEQVMMKKRLFDPATHQYLLHVMEQYVNWREHEQLSEERDSQKISHDGRTAHRTEFDDFKPSINTRTTRAFVFQLNGIGERPEYIQHPAAFYERMRSIAETLLFAVGYWPESVATKPLREEYGQMEHFASMGRTAYAKASDILASITKRQLSGQVTLLSEMSHGFISYAGVLYNVRSEFGDLPVRDAFLILRMSELLGDRTVEKKYLVTTEPPKKRIIN
ncbi:MAG: hypothetical protein KKD17_04510 [Nanoarchaeota archaeon]|nr:hypothetical protein [Nanoarchaeota archaeon]